MKTKGSGRPSGMDAKFHRRILCSKNFSIDGIHLREEIAALIRNLLKSINLINHPSLLEWVHEHTVEDLKRQQLSLKTTVFCRTL